MFRKPRHTNSCRDNSNNSRVRINSDTSVHVVFSAAAVSSIALASIGPASRWASSGRSCADEASLRFECLVAHSRGSCGSRNRRRCAGGAVVRGRI